MLKIGSLQLALTLAGCFFGAGFISGQELWQFFGRFGKYGLIGIFISCLFIAAVSFMTVDIAARRGIEDMDRVILPERLSVIKPAVGAAEVSLMFCTYIVMAAGAGTVVEQLTGSFALRIAGSAVFCSLVTFIAIKGVGSAVKIFACIVPVMIIAAAVVVIGILAKYGASGMVFTEHTDSNPLLGNWVFSTVSYIALNYFGAIGTIAALGKYTRSGKTRFAGAAMSFILLLAVAVGILLSVYRIPEVSSSELPLLALAGKLHPAVEVFVTIALVFAMFGASLSVFVPVPLYFSKFSFFSRRKVLYTILMSAAAFSASLIGFSTLVSIVYPIYGYLAIFSLIGLTVNFVKSFRREKV